MGKAARFACIFIPMALSITALVFLALVGLGQSNSSSYFLSNVYFLRANLSGAAQHSSMFGVSTSNDSGQADIQNGHFILFNSYSVGLWNYCAGGGQVAEGGAAPNFTDPSGNVGYCSPHETQYMFNPQEVWGLGGDFNTRFFSGDLDNALNKYEDGLAKAIGPMYIITVALAALSVLLGISGIFSRCGSILTTFCSGLTTTAAIAFASITTFAYFSLEAAFNSALNDQGISVSHGTDAFIFSWLAVAFLIVASLFWSFSSCCVSGRSRHRDREVSHIDPVYPPTGYQPMAGSGQFSHPVQPTSYAPARTGAYEPYRQS